ncbi:MAG: T9SS type A sorting domain-containing protein, partial [Flavobacteriales bacterium]
VVLTPLKIYPTPAVDVVTVECGTAADFEIQVFDTNGKIVFTNRGRGEKTQVPQLPSGAYVAAVRFGENTLSSTFTFR